MRPSNAIIGPSGNCVSDDNIAECINDVICPSPNGGMIYGIKDPGVDLVRFTSRDGGTYALPYSII